jgi:hypothetical protein
MRTAMLALLVLCAGALLSPSVAFAEDPPDAAAPAPAALDAAGMPQATAPAESLEIAEAPPGAAPAAAETDSSPWSDFGWKALDVATPIIGAVLVWALGMLARWLSSRTTNERLRALIETVRDAAATAVSSTQQAFVDALKEPGLGERGRLTDAQKSEALARALTACKAVLGTKGIDALKAAIGVGQAELDAYLTHQIEAAVAARKAATP